MAELVPAASIVGDPGAMPTRGPPLLDAWPAEALFRLKDQRGADDDWDVTPFPAKGPNTLAALRGRAAASFLVRGLGGVGPAVALSIEVTVGGRPSVLPLKDDAGLERALQLWGRCTGSPGGMITLLIHEARAAAAAAPTAAVAARSLLSAGPSLPVEMWARILNAVGSSRCVLLTAPL